MTQPTYVPLPSNVSFGTVTGRFLTAVADSPTDSDRDPEGSPATDLSIRFTPGITPAVVRDQSSTPPTIFALAEVVATVGPTGLLLGPDGQPGVRLVASTGAALDPSGWTWKVTLGSATFPSVSFSFALDPGASVDLATVVQVPAAPGATLDAWLQAVADARVARDAAVAAAGDPADTGYDVVLLLGQSNMQGAGGAPTALVDVTHPRVYSYARVGANASTLVQAADPLQHPNANSNGSVGPGMPFARWQAELGPGNRRVLLVPAAYSGAGIVNGNDPHRWDPSAAFASTGIGYSLYESAIAQAVAAVAAAGPQSRLLGAVWVGGEADVNVDPAAWRTSFEQIIDGLRDRLGAPALPFVIGSMVPEYASGGAIDLVQRATPTRKPFTAYVAGPSGYLFSGDGLGVHYTAAGARELGRRLVAGLAAAKANTAPASAVPASPPSPPTVTAPPPSSKDYTFASGAPAGWTTLPSATLATAGGNLQVPATAAYQTVIAPDVVDLAAHAVTWRLASIPSSTVGSSDVFLGVTLGTNTNQDSAGFTLDNGGAPWTAVRASVAGARTLDGTDGANRPVGRYRLSASGGNLIFAYSADGASWVTLHTLAAPWSLAAVRPVIVAGHWNAADADGAVAVAELLIA